MFFSMACCKGRNRVSRRNNNSRFVFGFPAEKKSFSILGTKLKIKSNYLMFSNDFFPFGLGLNLSGPMYFK